MDQEKLEAIVRNVISQTAGNQSDENISPLLKDLRDTVKGELGGQTSASQPSSNLADITKSVKNSLG